MSDLIDQASSGNLKAVRGLIDTGANVDAQDKQRRTALMLASKKGHLDIVKTLVNAGAALNLQSNERGYGGNTALMYACRHGHLEVVKTLINVGADIDSQGKGWDHEGYTALIYAVYSGHQRIVKVLIDAGADINIQNGSGQIALICASLMGYLEIVKVLIDAGADINIQNGSGQTALIRASRKGHLEIVKTLIQAGANLNLQGQAEWTFEKGWTALIHASRVGHLEVVKSLVDAGADLHLKTVGGWTALKHALDQKHKEVVKVLEDAASRKTRDSDPDDCKSSVMFFTSLFTALGYLSKVDGKVSQEEISFVANAMNEMQLDAEQRRQAEDLFRMGKQAPAIALMTLLSNLKNDYKNDYQSLQEFMKNLVQLVYVDNVISEQEQLAIKEIATQLGIEQSVLNAIEDSLLSKPKDDQGRTSPNPSKHSKLTKISADLFEINGYLAKLDGRISREEVQAITGLINEMQLETDQRRQAENLFRRGKQASEENMLTLVSNLQEQYHETPEVLNILVMILMQVAYADGDMTDSEQQMIRTIAMQLSLDEIALSIIEVAVCCPIQNTKYLDLHDAYKIIGVSDAASHLDIKKAWISLLKTYHPDALQAKGLPKEMLVFGKRLSQTFNLAYDRIKADRKF